MKRIILIPMVVGICVLLPHSDNHTNADPELISLAPINTALLKTGDAILGDSGDHSILEADARQMMDDFRANNPFESHGWYLSREAYEYLLSNPEAVGIRIYGGLKVDGSFSPVLIGVDSSGVDLIKSPSLNKGTVIDPLDNGIRERAEPCPPKC